MATLKTLKEAVLEAVTVLDECDGSRTASNEAIDAVREILADAYGPEFDGDLEEFEADTDGDGIADDDEDETDSE